MLKKKQIYRLSDNIFIHFAAETFITKSPAKDDLTYEQFDNNSMKTIVKYFICEKKGELLNSETIRRDIDPMIKRRSTNGEYAISENSLKQYVSRINTIFRNLLYKQDFIQSDGSTFRFADEGYFVDENGERIIGIDELEGGEIAWANAKHSVKYGYNIPRPWILEDMEELAKKAFKNREYIQSMSIRKQICEARGVFYRAETNAIIDAKLMYAVSLRKLHHFDEAIQLENESLEILNKYKSDNDFEMIYAKLIHSMTLRETNMNEEALAIQKSLLNIVKKGDVKCDSNVTKENDKNKIAFLTLDIKREMASTYTRLDDGDKALALKKELYDYCENNTDSIGKYERLEMKARLAISLNRSGNPQNSMWAFNLRKEYLEELGKDIGTNHQDYLVGESNLASSYLSLGKNDKAIEIWEHILKVRTAMLGYGDDDEAVQNVKWNLSRAYLAKGDFVGSISMLEDIYKERKSYAPDNYKRIQIEEQIRMVQRETKNKFKSMVDTLERVHAITNDKVDVEAIVKDEE